MRKGYHLLALALFLPPLRLEAALLGVALAAAFCALLAVEALRLSGLPGIGGHVGWAGLSVWLQSQCAVTRWGPAGPTSSGTLRLERGLSHRAPHGC